MIEALLFAWQAFRVFRRHQRSTGTVIAYVHDSFGLPQVTMLVGTGREAWRVSMVATEYFAIHGGRECDATPPVSAA